MGPVELRCRSNFSFLRGASQPEELVDRAAELGFEALALTNLDGLYGVVRAHQQARLRGLRLIVGAELTLEPGELPGADSLVLLAMDRSGYGNLCRLITGSKRSHPKGQAGLALAALAARNAGLFALFPGVDATAAARLRELFGERLALAIARHRIAGDEARIAAARTTGKQLGIPLAATGEVHTHHRSRQPLQDVLTCIRLGIPVQEAGRRLFPNAERTLQSPAELARLWRDLPQALAQSAEIAARCTFSLDAIRGEYPREPRPQGLSAIDYLRRLCDEGAATRYPQGLPAEVSKQLAHELTLIAQLDFPDYFLTVWELVRFARERGILCQGRGSAANSVVCYLLGITSIDPVRMGLLFERFISVERGEPPDIDVDFEHERREEVIQYAYARYGRDRAGMVCEVISYRGKGALRDVGKAMGLSLIQVDRLARALGGWAGVDEATPELLAAAGLDAGNPTVQLALTRAAELQGFPRHLGIHVGGMCLTREPLEATAPIENATMPGRTVVQWDKDDLAALNLLKVDLLGLGMLTMIRKCLALVETHAGQALTLATIPAEDPRVYDMICAADTIGVFQIESRAQMSMLPRLRPRCFYDLVIEVAIIRPGPIQGGMVHPYLRRRSGAEKIEYPHPSLKPVLERTLGILLFQEQAMRLAVVAAGFTPGEADELRRSMTHKRAKEKLEALKGKLVAGMTAKGIALEYTENIFKQLLGFSGYGFPESHSASFALLAYASSWLKCHHPAAFTCALLNSQPMGFYAPHTLVEDAKRHGVEIRGVDAMASEWDCTLEGPRSGEAANPGEIPAIRLGLRQVKGLPQAVAEALVTERKARPFDSLGDLVRRVQLPRTALEKLAAAEALSAFEPSRRSALWTALATPTAQGDLFAGMAPIEPVVALPGASVVEELVADYASTGLSMRGHPMHLLRERLTREGVCSAAGLERCAAGAGVEVAGLVIVRQHPGTARGVIFISLEDETGICNLVIMPDVYERFRAVVRGAAFLRVRGKVERVKGVINVKVEALRPLGLAPRIGGQSRDFR